MSMERGPESAPSMEQKIAGRIENMGSREDVINLLDGMALGGTSELYDKETGVHLNTEHVARAIQSLPSVRELRDEVPNYIVDAMQKAGIL